MSNIDKQALREEFQYMQDHYSDPADRDRQIIYIAAEALLDENIQLQREKDATEAVLSAMRDDMRQAREQLKAAEHTAAVDHEAACSLVEENEELKRRIAELERSETQLINERDDAESALNDAYKAVMGHAPEWRNWFSFENAIDEIELACEQWRNQTDDVIQFRQRIQELEAKLANPVLLPKTNGYWNEQEKAYEEAITLAKRQVRLAGFSVEDM